MRNATIFLFGVIVILGGSIWLQIFLSKRTNRWLGLVIPLICFLFSIVMTLSVPYSSNTSLKVQEFAEDGSIVREEVSKGESNHLSVGETLATMIPVFAISNVSSIIYLAIYGACRESRKKNSELKKMNIQDLE